MISSNSSSNYNNISISYCIKSIKRNNDYNSSNDYNNIRNCNWINIILIYFLAKNKSSISKRGGGSNSRHNANFSHYMIMMIIMDVRGITCLTVNFFVLVVISIWAVLKIMVESVVFVMISL